MFKKYECVQRLEYLGTFLQGHYRESSERIFNPYIKSESERIPTPWWNVVM